MKHLDFHTAILKWSNISIGCQPFSKVMGSKCLMYSITTTTNKPFSLKLIAQHPLFLAGYQETKRYSMDLSLTHLMYTESVTTTLRFGHEGQYAGFAEGSFGESSPWLR